MNEVRIGGSLVVEALDTPTRKGEYINLLQDIYDITTPYKGMKVFCAETGMEYVVTELTEKTINGVVVTGAMVKSFIPLAYKGDVEALEEYTKEKVERLDDVATIRFSRILEGTVNVAPSKVENPAEIVFYKAGGKFVAKNEQGKYFDEWDGKEAYMKNGKLRKDCVYMSEGSFYMWNGTTLVLDVELTNEIARAQAEELSLQSNIAAEVERATAQEQQLQKNIVAEENRAKTAEGKLREGTTARFARFVDSASISTGIPDTFKEVVYIKSANRFAAADNGNAYWDTWSGMDEYMNGNEVRKDKVYLCGDATYVFHNGALRDRVAELIGEAPEALDSIHEIADWINNDESGAAAMARQISENKAAITTESERAKGAESQLGNAISTEAQRATGAEAQLLSDTLANSSYINDIINNKDSYFSNGRSFALKAGDIIFFKAEVIGNYTDNNNIYALLYNSITGQEIINIQLSSIKLSNAICYRVEEDYEDLKLRIGSSSKVSCRLLVAKLNNAGNAKFIQPELYVSGYWNGSINAYDILFSSSTDLANPTFIDVEPFGKYRIVGNNNHYQLGIWYYDQERNSISRDWFSNIEEFTAPANCRYIQIGLRNTNNSVTPHIPRIQIVEGSSSISNIDAQLDMMSTNDSLVAVSSSRFGLSNGKEGSSTLNLFVDKQSCLVGQIITGIKIDIADAGVLSIIKCSGYLTSEPIFTTIANYDVKKGINYLKLQEPVVLSEGEAIGINPTSCSFVRGNNDSVDALGYYYYNKSSKWVRSTADIVMAIICRDSSKIISDTKKISASVKSTVYPTSPSIDYHHLFIDKIYIDSEVTIPCQSVFDVHVAAKLGFKMIEVNVLLTSDGVPVTGHQVGTGVLQTLTNLNGEPTAVNIPNITFAELRENYRYKSIFPQYRTPITSLEEFLLEARKFNITPFVQCVSDSVVGITEAIMGKRYVAYGATRAQTDATIYEYRGGTIEETVARCKTVGYPYIYGVSSSVLDTLTDEAIKELVSRVHAEGCWLAWAGCYHSEENNQRYRSLGLDVCASGWNVPEFEYGDEAFIYGNSVKGFADFDGTFANDNGVAVMADKQFMNKAFEQKSIIAKGSLNIQFEGKIGITFGKISCVVTNDGSREEVFTSIIENMPPNIYIYAYGNVKIFNISYKASSVI